MTGIVVNMAAAGSYLEKDPRINRQMVLGCEL